MSTTLTILLALAAIIAVALGLAPLRRRLVSAPVLGLLRRGLPQVSPTEQEALDAGTVWWERELFMGSNWIGWLLARGVPRDFHGQLSASREGGRLFLRGRHKLPERLHRGFAASSPAARRG